MPVHSQGDWQSGVMMYMQGDPQASVGAHQQGGDPRAPRSPQCLMLYIPTFTLFTLLQMTPLHHVTVRRRLVSD